MNIFSNKKGFTLIELLVVITLIAILAVAVLAAINPVEQRRKALDTGANSAAAEVRSALQRYFLTYGCYPWNDAAADTVINCAGGTAVGAAYNALLNAAATNMDLLVTAGEIKQTLVTEVTAATNARDPKTLMGVGFQTDGDDIHVCYRPVSAASINLATGQAVTRTNTWTTPAAAGTHAICVPDTVQRGV